MRDALTGAREWGVRPMVMLGVPAAEWSEADRFLALALTLHDKDLCPGKCGHYLDETAGLDGWHELDHIVCDACRTRDEYEDDPKPGELRWVKRSPA